MPYSLDPAMLLDANVASEVPAKLSADVVVVGGGTVGLFLADAICEAEPLSHIIVVEAGAAVAATIGNQATSASIGKRHEGVHLGRAAGIGGTSTLWGGQLAEFSSSDLERHDAPWPMGFAELQRHYRTVYARLRVGPPESPDVYRRQFGGETAASGEVERFFTYWLDQPNFAVFYRKLIQRTTPPRVIMNLTANGCEFDGDNARSVKCVTPAGRIVHIAARRFVFAAGTVALSRFFLSTRIRGGVPWSASAAIGSHFQDHLGGQIATVSVLNEAHFRDYFENGWVNGVKLQPKLTLCAASRRSLPSGACGFFTFDSSLSENLANIKRTVRGLHAGLSFSSLASRVVDVATVGRSMLPIVSRYARSRRIFALFDRGVRFHVQAEQIPLAASRISLMSTEPAADGLLPVAVDWRCEGGELAAIRQLAVSSRRYLKDHGLADLTIAPALEGRDPGFLDGLGDTYHQCGGMRMSSAPDGGAVDANCRVWGTSNVWVAGAAVLPSSSHANCTLTALALAARLSQHLAGHGKA